MIARSIINLYNHAGSTDTMMLCKVIINSSILAAGTSPSETWKVKPLPYCPHTPGGPFCTVDLILSFLTWVSSSFLFFLFYHLERLLNLWRQ